MATKKPAKVKLIKDKIYTETEMDEIAKSEYPDEFLKGDWTEDELNDLRHFRKFEITLHNLKVKERAASKN